MRFSLSFPLLLSAADHNYNAALRLYGPPAMVAGDMQLPSEPRNAVVETNRETLFRLGRELALIGREELTAVDAYRLYLPAACNQSMWGYCVEAARVVDTNEILVFFRSDEDEYYDRTLRWIPLSRLCTRKQAQASYQVQYIGPAEEVMYEILQLFRDVFEVSAGRNWSYQKRVEFYHSFPFEELNTKEEVLAFRPTLFGCPAFTGFKYQFPEC